MPAARSSSARSESAKRRRPWSGKDDALLRSQYADSDTQALADELGRSARAVYIRAGALGLSKSEARMREQRLAQAALARTDPRFRSTQFKKGMTPWNAGIKGSTGNHPNSVATQFKAGQMRGAAQQKYVPVGSLRVSKDGHLERKVTDDPAIPPQRRWVGVHRLVWESAHGPVPRGRIVVFKPGRATATEAEVTLDRLECISRQENMRRNSYHTRHPETAKLYQLKGAIARQVNRIAREAKEKRA